MQGFAVSGPLSFVGRMSRKCSPGLSGGQSAAKACVNAPQALLGLVSHRLDIAVAGQECAEAIPDWILHRERRNQGRLRSNCCLAARTEIRSAR
jgi:hypothetical protein